MEGDLWRSGERRVDDEADADDDDSDESMIRGRGTRKKEKERQNIPAPGTKEKKPCSEPTVLPKNGRGQTQKVVPVVHL